MIKNLFTQYKRIILISGAALIVLFIIVFIAVHINNGNSDTLNDNTDKIITPTVEITVTPVISATPSPAVVITPEPTLEVTPEPTLKTTPEPTPGLGDNRSYLTGEYISDEVFIKRPYAIMFNNIINANPQSGVGEASILYEALTEAGITRLMGVFEGLTEASACAERIGSVRSARHYFASFADEYDAIFIHYGETTYATKKIAKLNLDHVEGIYAEGGIVYYRDNTIKSPHNAFATLEGIHKGISYLKIREDHPEAYKSNHFVFNEEETVNTEGKDATKVTLPFSSFVPYFTYNEDTKLYYRFQFKGEHIDYNTGEQLTFKNLIIQFVNEWDKDKNGYQDMDIAKSSGHGYYISCGKCVPITWEKNESKRFMMYYDEKGNVLSINPGKTYIAIFPDSRESRVTIE